MSIPHFMLSNIADTVNKHIITIAGPYETQQGYEVVVLRAKILNFFELPKEFLHMLKQGTSGKIRSFRFFNWFYIESLI